MVEECTAFVGWSNSQAESYKYSENPWNEGTHKPNAGQQNTVDATKLDVNLETQVGNGLRRRFVDVLRLNALRCHPEHYVTDAFHLGWIQTTTTSYTCTTANTLRAIKTRHFVFYYNSGVLWLLCILDQCEQKRQSYGRKQSVTYCHGSRCRMSAWKH